MSSFAKEIGMTKEQFMESAMSAVGFSESEASSMWDRAETAADMLNTGNEKEARKLLESVMTDAIPQMMKKLAEDALKPDTFESVAARWQKSADKKGVYDLNIHVPGGVLINGCSDQSDGMIVSSPTQEFIQNFRDATNGEDVSVVMLDVFDMTDQNHAAAIITPDSARKLAQALITAADRVESL
jgi:hypothetical protein